MARAVAYLDASLQASGELHDPVFGEPTQYGTAYFAYVNAALATLALRQGASAGPTPVEHYRDAARRGLRATLVHLADASRPPAASRFSRELADPGWTNHRDFMWPPAQRGLRLLRDLRIRDLAELESLSATVAVPEAFARRPPNNWAAVWLLGEWMRQRDGRSPHNATTIDRWIAAFFTEEMITGGTEPRTPIRAIDLGAGRYHEPGLSNAYDLFTRLHLLELLAEGYQGPEATRLQRLARTGLARSLAVQLSNGSLASAHRSSAHLWNLAAQCLYFHRCAALFSAQEPDLAAEARDAAARAFVALCACERPSGGLSPVEHVLPGDHRVGYELYTMEAHYVSLALGFLATAVLDGFAPAQDPPQHPNGHLVEAAPFHRSLVHAEGWSVHVNLAPEEGYDAFGIADVTLGLGRRLRFGGQVHCGSLDGAADGHGISTQLPLTLGIALRDARRALRPLAAMRPAGARTAHAAPGRLNAHARVEDLDYALEVRIDKDHAHFEERASDAHCSLLVPYLRDRGDGLPTTVERQPDGIVLSSGAERVALWAHGPIERIVHLGHGYESRHGLVGLVRIDLREPGPIRYSLQRLK